MVQITLQKHHLLALCTALLIATAASAVNIRDSVTNVFGELNVEGNLDLNGNSLQGVDWESSDTSGLAGQIEGEAQVWIEDSDGDGYGAADAKVRASKNSPGSSWTEATAQSIVGGIDCQPSDGDAHPGAGFHNTDYENNDWDENCNGKIEKETEYYDCGETYNVFGDYTATNGCK